MFLHHRKETWSRIAEAEFAHLARLLQSRESARHLFGIREKIRAMELVNVDGFDTEALQRSFAGNHDMLVRKIVAIWRMRIRLAGAANPALRRDDRAAAKLWNFLHHFAENCFAHAIAIDVGVIEQSETRFKRSDDRLSSVQFALGRAFGAFPAGDPPTAVAHATANKLGVGEADGLHVFELTARAS